MRLHSTAAPLAVATLAALLGCGGISAPTPAPTPTPAAAATTPASAPMIARAQQTIPLWTSGAPGALGNTPADQPELTPYLPPAGRANGTGVVIFPGGGYQHLSMTHEGSEIANWLAGLGITTFVVKYRLGPTYHHPTMLTDAQRAIRIARSRAAEWGVDPNRLGVIGFSAGGHLASTTGTHFDAGTASSSDPIERASSRPDFMILMYPVITMRDSVTHAGSRLNLLGKDPSAELVHLLSNETQVTSQTPPTFLVHTVDDRTVPVENSLLFYRALRAAGVSTELHIYEHGPHGFGLATTNPVLSSWTMLCENWMRMHGWLGTSK